MLSWNFLVNGFVIRAILSIMGMAMYAGTALGIDVMVDYKLRKS